MHYTKDLVFFDKHGTGYGFDYDSDKDFWTGSIFIEPVSEGLFETEKIIVMQKYCMHEEAFDSQMSNSVKRYEYGYPATIYDYSSTQTDKDYYEFRWDADVKEVDEIQMFGFNTQVCPPEDSSALTFKEYNCPDIVYMNNVRIEDLCSNPISYDSSGQNGNVHFIDYKKENTWKTKHADIDLCFCDVNDEYSTFRRDLHMYYVDPNSDTEKLVGLFTVYAKSIEEDERLTTMCKNLGYSIDNVDFSIFQDSDIKEQLIDFDLMNKKRKEILMEGHNIYPYIGSYKSLINAIRFFGYDNVTIKEWWRNVDVSSENFNKYFMASTYSLKDHEIIHDENNVRLPSKKYRKTGKLSLVYNINKPNDNVDAQSSYYGHAYPQTDEQFDYTIEEAVIKLYGLKRKLEKEFLPLTTKIIDIVGEADAFYASTIRESTSQNISFANRSGSRSSFKVLGSEDSCFYIEDLRPFGIHANELPSGNGIVGESRNENANYIGAGLKSLYDANVVTGSELQEFGQNVIGDYNTNWSIGTDYGGRGQDIQMAGSLADILDIEGTGSCETGTDYTGPTGVVAPYADDGNLFGAFGTNVANCSPWIYYIQANSNNAGNYYLAEFSSYYPNLNKTYRQANDFYSDENTHLPDNENIPIGALVELMVDSPESIWDEFDKSWNHYGICPWNYLDLLADNICRAEWVIHKDVDNNPGFDTTIAGEVIYGYSDIGVVLPYVGDYDVTLNLYDFNNNISVVHHKNAVTVLPREIEFTGWCRMKKNQITWYDERSWESLSNEWNFAYDNNLTWNDMRSASFNGMDRAFFIGQYIDSHDIDESVMIYNYADLENEYNYSLTENNSGPYVWDNLDVAWQDMDHLWWNAMNITGDIPCYFEFGYFDASANAIDSPDGVNDSLPGKWLEIVDKNNKLGIYKFPNVSSSSLNYIADVTRQLNESTDSVISQFFYSYVWDVNSSAHSNLNVPDGFHIVATSKNHGRTGDVKFVGIVKSQCLAYTDSNNVLHARIDQDNKQLRFFTKSVECNPNWNDTLCINNITRIPAYTDVNFNYTNCRILGKTNPRWKFTNLNSGTTYNSTNKNYHRMFKEKGCWEVSLTLNDSNGNVYSAARNLLMIV